MLPNHVQPGTRALSRKAGSQLIAIGARLPLQVDGGDEALAFPDLAFDPYVHRLGERDGFRIAARAEPVGGPHLAAAVKEIKSVVQRVTPAKKAGHTALRGG